MFPEKHDTEALMFELNKEEVKESDITYAPISYNSRKTEIEGWKTMAILHIGQINEVTTLCLPKK